MTYDGDPKWLEKRLERAREYRERLLADGSDPDRRLKRHKKEKQLRKRKI